MCSIGEDDFGDEGGVHAMIPDVKSTDLDGNGSDRVLCNKCGKPDAIYKLQFRQPECSDCFLLYARHKFRAVLGSSKILPKDAKVLLIFDGSPESIVLLDMLHHAQTQNTFKRLHCTARVLFIDDLFLCSNNVDAHNLDYLKNLNEISNLLAEYEQFESYVVPLVRTAEVSNCLYSFKSLNELYLMRNIEKESSLLDFIKSIKSLTSRQDFVKHHRSKLMAQVAKQFQYKFVFISDICSDLAADLLAAISLGRGCSAALDVALVDDRLSDDIKLIRPLKDLNSQEVDLYLKARNIKSLAKYSYGCDLASTASLQNLTRSFVDNLQKNFSSTVSTVFRTGDKIAANHDLTDQFKQLQIKSNNSDDENEATFYCKFCNSILDYKDSTTLLAIEFSRLVSECGSSLRESSTDLSARAKLNVDGSKNNGDFKRLCHACRNIIMESGNDDFLNL